jgi:ABC-type uncharacterized transport system substrate-binding protein
VFTNKADPVADGTVTSLARPGGNATGFAATEYGFAVKLLELLQQIAPQVTRIAVVRSTLGGRARYSAIQAAAPVGVQLTPINPRDADEIERGITAFARGANDGLISTGSTQEYVNRDVIIGLAARYRLPAVYANRCMVAAGGLISYGAANIEVSRGAAGYANRILKGEKPADLPVQMTTKYEMVLNMKTAKALGLVVPDIVRVRADEVIE